MKTRNLIAICCLASTHLVLATEAPAIPVGHLEINHLMVRQGVAPQINWQITYPTKVTDVVDIPPTDEIIPKTRLRVKVSMVGVGLTDQYGTQYPAKSKIRFGNSGWQNLFTGKGNDVNPNNVLVNRIVEAGEKIRFRAKVNVNGYGYFYNDDANITVLKNGDNPPSVAAGYDHQTPVASYLRPYMKNGKIAIGPMDVLYVSELTHTDPSNSGYDMQDSIVLVQFERVASE